MTKRLPVVNKKIYNKNNNNNNNKNKNIFKNDIEEWLYLLDVSRTGIQS